MGGDLCAEHAPHTENTHTHVHFIHVYFIHVHFVHTHRDYERKQEKAPAGGENPHKLELELVKYNYLF